MITGLISKTPKKLPIISIIITCFLLSYVFFLIISNYVSQTSLQQTILKQFKLENEREAITLSNFFYNRKEDLIYLAESGTIKVFFENRALGMSMQYGLKQSLPPIKEMFRALLDRYKNNNDSFYLRIAFLDGKGNVLVEAYSSTGMHQALTGTKKLLSPEHTRPVIILKGGGKEIIVSVAYYFKGEYSGQIVAWLKPEFLQSQISDSEHQSYILANKEIILQSGKNGTAPDFEIFKADLPQEFSMEDRRGRNRDMVGIKTPVYDTPFSLVTIVPVQHLFGRVRPTELLVGMAILAVIIISGAVFIYRLNLKAFNYARSLIEASLDPFVTIDVDGRIMDVNSATEKVTGIMRDKLIGSDFSDYFTEPEIARIGYQQVFSQGYISDYPLAIRDSSGKVTDVLYNASIYLNEQGKIAGVFAVARDITKRQHTEELLREEKEFSTGIINETPAIICGIGPDGSTTFINRAGQTITGYDAEELIGKNWWTTFYPGDEYQQVEQLLHNLKKGNVRDYEMTLTTRDGEKRTISWNSLNRYDKDGNIVQFIGFGNDITDRRHTERELLASEKKYRLLFDSAPVGIGVADLGGNILAANSAMEKTFGYTSDEMQNIKTRDTYVNPDERTRIINEVIRKGLVEDKEVRLKKKDGTIYDALLNINLTEMNGRKVLFTILRDITEHKQAEKQIRQSLREKEALLREIHHRVKNNMAVVSSLLSLQARTIKDATVKSLFEESQQRVRSMALVHEKLYQTKDLSSINFEDYIRSIISEIISLYLIDTSAITMEIDIQDIELDLESAVPCGLIINELLTNALKYAFPDNRGGVLSVHFTKDEGTYTLSIKDNGVGLPEGFDYKEASTLGLQLVKVLTGQLRGTLQIKSDEGTEAIVTFKTGRK